MVDVHIHTTQTSGSQLQEHSQICRGVQQLNIDKSQVASVNFSQLADRRRSFNRAPLCDVAHSKFNPSLLSEAGLYYEYNDSYHIGLYRCFRCALREDAWNFSVDPFELHLKKSAECSYIRNVLAMRRGQLNPAAVLNTKQNTQNRPNPDCVNDPKKTEGQIQLNQFSSRLEADGGQNGDVAIAASTSANKFKGDSDERDRLRKSIRRLKNNCRKCKDGKIETLFLPCRHILACESCADQMVNCMSCNAEILGTAKVYFS